MSNTYKAGLKFERITAGVYRVININGRIVANISRGGGYLCTIWKLITVEHEPQEKVFFKLSQAKSAIKNTDFQTLHLAEA